MSCLICDKHKGDHKGAKYFVFRNKLLSVYHMFPEEDKVYQGYLFIELNRHIGEIDEMTYEEAAEVGRFQKLIPEVLKSKHLIEHVYIFQFGDQVPHIHFHVVPRYEGTPKEYRGMRVDEWKGAPFLDDEALVQYCKALGDDIKTTYINYLADVKIAAGEDGEEQEVTCANDVDLKTGGYEQNDFFNDDEGWAEDDPLDGTPFPRWG